MVMNAQRLLLVSCLHCLHPVTLADGIGDLEIARLQEHLRECMPGELVGRAPGADEVLRHFRMVGYRGR